MFAVWQRRKASYTVWSDMRVGITDASWWILISFDHLIFLVHESDFRDGSASSNYRCLIHNWTDGNNNKYILNCTKIHHLGLGHICSNTGGGRLAGHMAHTGHQTLCKSARFILNLHTLPPHLTFSLPLLDPLPPLFTFVLPLIDFPSPSPSSLCLHSSHHTSILCCWHCSGPESLSYGSWLSSSFLSVVSVSLHLLVLLLCHCMYADSTSRL